jgi:hypothetical protein
VCFETEINDAEAANTTARIKAFQQAASYRRGQPMPSATGRLTTGEIGILSGRPGCDRKRFQNAFESYYIWAGRPSKDAKINSPALIEALNNKITDPAKKLPPNASAEEVRNRIPDLREGLATQLVLTDNALSKQFTRDLWNLLTGIQ